MIITVSLNRLTDTSPCLILEKIHLVVTFRVFVSEEVHDIVDHSALLSSVLENLTNIGRLI